MIKHTLFLGFQNLLKRQLTYFLYYSRVPTSQSVCGHTCYECKRPVILPESRSHFLNPDVPRWEFDPDSFFKTTKQEPVNLLWKISLVLTFLIVLIQWKFLSFSHTQEGQIFSSPKNLVFCFSLSQKPSTYEYDIMDGFFKNS